MTTTQLIELLKTVENGASGRSREIRIYSQTKNLKLKKIILKEANKLEILSTGDGLLGAELTLIIN